MTSVGFGWRSGALSFFVLLMVAVGSFGVAAQFDGRPAGIGIAERLFMGVIIGIYLTALAVPVLMVVAALLGITAGIWHRRRTAELSTPGVRQVTRAPRPF